MGLSEAASGIRSGVHPLRVIRGKPIEVRTYCYLLTRVQLQTKLLFTYDPRALHAIYVKEQDVYEESDILLSYGTGIYFCKPALTCP